MTFFRKQDYTLCTYIDLHFPVQTIVQKQVMGHSDSMRLHRMALAIVVVSYVTFVQNTNKIRRHTRKMSVQTSPDMFSVTDLPVAKNCETKI